LVKEIEHGIFEIDDDDLSQLFLEHEITLSLHTGQEIVIKYVGV